ncbi:hypothetical protein E0485_18895 [Paenibacillus albiflavus]|uniref:Uncharacterized protein n=1 Tax=Paenibacillus albiflavus TaxID=2545760 RepID=A0A4R4EAY0_9BACL|nr:hypothetical protein [Paenibacillus albiflavus]TCZ75058.1 hypothetical protein E0485_18895 [Paenibacillus albiflavus]
MVQYLEIFQIFDEVFATIEVNRIHDFIISISEILKQYHGLQCILGEISDEHLNIILNNQIEKLTAVIVTWLNYNIERKKEILSALKSNLINLLFVEGYWVQKNVHYKDGEHIVEFLSSIYSLFLQSQKSVTARTPQTMHKINLFLNEYVQSYNKRNNEFINLKEPIVATALKNYLKTGTLPAI